MHLGDAASVLGGSQDQSRTGGYPAQSAVGLSKTSVRPSGSGTRSCFEVWTIAEAAAQSSWFYGVFGSIFVIFGGLALFMASAGLHGVLSFSVSRRTQEMGIRMALGAGRNQLLKLVLGQGLKQIAVGLVIGLVLAGALSNLLGFLMVGVNPRDPGVFGFVLVLTLGVGVAASLVPAQKATGVDPNVALRAE